MSGTRPDGRRNYSVTYNDDYSNVEDYLARSRMAENGVSDVDFEVFLRVC